MPILKGASKVRYYKGTNKVKKIYKGSTKVWSGASVVSYYYGSTLLGTEEVDEGEDVLRPSTISTAKSGYTLIGWATSNSESSIVTSLVATGEPMTLYAIYLPNSYTAVSAEYTTGSDSISKQDTNYVSGTIVCKAGRNTDYGGAGTTELSSSWTIKMGRYRSVTVVGKTVESAYGSHSYALTWDGSAVGQSNGTYTTKTYTANGTHTFYAKCTASSGYGAIGIGITSVVFSDPKPWV